MELFVKADSSLFINWLRSTVGSYNEEVVRVKEKDYFVSFGYTPKSKNKEIQTLYDNDIEGFTLNPCLVFTGLRLPDSSDFEENKSEDENGPDAEIPIADDIPLGSIVISNLGGERLQIDLNAWEPSMEQLFTIIAKEIIRIWH